VAVDDPAHVAGPMRPERVEGLGLVRLAQQGFDYRHGLDEATLIPVGEAGDEPAHHFPRGPVEGLEGGAPRSGERQMALARIFIGANTLHEARSLETLQDAAQIAGIEPEVAPDFSRRRAGPVGQLVEDAGFREREGAVQEALLQHTEAAGVETREPPHGADAPVAGLQIINHGRSSGIEDRSSID
jgi:hypothetical protein